MDNEMNLNDEEQRSLENLCRVCQTPGLFELSENIFECDGAQTTLLTAFNTFSSLDNDDAVIYLCQTCSDQLMDAYRFSQRVKLSDQRFGLKLLQVEADFSPDEAATYDERLNELVELLESDDEADVQPIKLKREAQRNKKSNETAKRLRESSPKKSIKTDVAVNFALPQFVISSNTNDDDTTCDVYFDENATNRIEYDATLLNDLVNSSTSQFESDPSPARNKVKTLKTSAIVAPNLQEISDLCAITIDGGHDSQSIYQCKYCPKAFAAPYHLMVHTRKSHQCQYCLSAFVKVADLYKHVKETHNSFDCLLCGRTFRTNGNLRQHMRKNHSVFLPAHVSLLNASEAKNIDE